MKLIWPASPRALLYFDGFGAILTASFVGIILPRFFAGVGLAPETLTTMAWYGVGCGVWSFSMAIFAYKPQAWMFGVIMAANSLYALLALRLLQLHRDMTLWGQLYFAFEILLLILIVLIEWNVFSQLRRSRRSP